MRRTLSIITAAFLFVACTKRDMVTAPDDFTVITDKTTYSVNETIHFKFTGNPENIVLWSGKPGEKYEYRNRTFLEGTRLLLNFKSFSQYAVDQTNLKLLVSNDFNGVYEPENVKAATWKDITSRAKLSDGNDNAPSGEIDLSDIASENKNIAIAFRYITNTLPVTNRWVIRSFDLDNVGSDGSSTKLLTMATAGWKAFSFANNSTTWSITSVQLLTVRSSTELDDDWVITKTINPNAVMPDNGQPIKNISNNLTEYSLTYTTPGVYKVSFVATNASYRNEASIVRELELTIVP